MKFIIRELTKNDLKPGKGFFRTLANLVETKENIYQRRMKIFKKIKVGRGATIKSMSYQKRLKIFKEIKKGHGIVFIAVSQEKETKGQIIGTVKFIRDRKFARGGALAAHLEDLVTRKGYECQGIAKALWSEFLKRARKLGCYKIILDCPREQVPFYRKLGFHEFEICLRLKP